MGVPPPPRHVPWEEWPKAVAITLLGVILACTIAIGLSDWIDLKPSSLSHPWTALALLIYIVIMIVGRFLQSSTYSIYELLWGCNVALILASIGMFSSRPILISIALAIVSGDQLCWYIDLLWWTMTGKFPIGVTKYLFRPENSTLFKRISSSHHLWFIPLSIVSLYGYGGMHSYSFPLSCMITGFLAIYSRATTPFMAIVPHEKHPIYLNINGAYEFWKDIPIPLLHRYDHEPAILYLPYLIFTGNIIANGVPHLVLLSISSFLENKVHLEN